jgi:hypothetical protein
MHGEDPGHRSPARRQGRWKGPGFESRGRGSTS